MAESSGRMYDRLDPGRLAVRRGADCVVQCRRRAVRRPHRLEAEGEPEQQPQQLRAGAAQRTRECHRRRGTSRLTRAGPHQDGHQRVEDHGSGQSGERRDRPSQHPAETLSEPPDSDRPGDGCGQCGLGGPPTEQSDGNSQLGQREKRVPHEDVSRHQVCRPLTGNADEGRARETDRFDGLVRKIRREHVGLKLQPRIDQPEQPQRGREFPAQHLRRRRTRVNGRGARAPEAPGHRDRAGGKRRRAHADS